MFSRLNYHLQVWPSLAVSPMVIVKTELCHSEDCNIKQEPQALPTVGTNDQADSLIDLTDIAEDDLQDTIDMRDQFGDQETEASQSQDDCPVTAEVGDIQNERREERQEDRLSEWSNEIIEKTKRKEITEEKNLVSKKIEKKMKKLTNKKIDNLRLVRKEGFFTINPHKNKMKTFNRIKENKDTSSR